MTSHETDQVPAHSGQHQAAPATPDHPERDQLPGHDRRGVGAVRPTERVRGDAGHGHGVRREPGLHLGVAEGDRQDRDRHHAQQRPVAQHHRPGGLLHRVGGRAVLAVLGARGRVDRGGAAGAARHRDQHEDVGEVGQAVDQVEALERRDRGHVDDRGADQPADAEPGVEQHEVQAVDLLPRLGRHQPGQHRGRRRPQPDGADDDQRADDEGAGDVLDEPDRGGARRLDHQAGDHHRARPEPVDQGAADRAQREAEQPHPREHQADRGRRDAADLGEVDVQERHGQPAAEGREREPEEEAVHPRVEVAQAQLAGGGQDIGHEVRFSVLVGAVSQLLSGLPGPDAQPGRVSPGCAGIRRTNQSDRGSVTGSTRAAAVSTVAPSRAGQHQRELQRADLGQVVLQLGDPAGSAAPPRRRRRPRCRGSRTASARP